MNKELSLYELLEILDRKDYNWRFENNTFRLYKLQNTRIDVWELCSCAHININSEGKITYNEF